MKKIKNTRALTSLSLIIIILFSAIVGALLSYLGVIGYFVSTGFKIPEDSTTITIESVDFDPENVNFFSLTIVNPSYSKSDVEIIAISMKVEGNDEFINITSVDPELPYILGKGEESQFECFENWGEYAGREISVYIDTEKETSGATISVDTTEVWFEIVNPVFNSSQSVKDFSFEVSNPSAYTLNVSEIWWDLWAFQIEPKNVTTPENTTLEYPYPVDPGETVLLKCVWDWTNFQGTNHTLRVRTTQGYSASLTLELPTPVLLTIPKVEFSLADTNKFNVTVSNSEVSASYVNVNNITLRSEDGNLTTLEVTNVVLPQIVLTGENVMFECLWDWTEYRNKPVINVTAYTSQGFVSFPNSTYTPSYTALSITTWPVFNLTDTNHFNITLRNSQYSSGAANITKIVAGVNIITGSDVSPSLPYLLNPGGEIEFQCTYPWMDYEETNITITVFYIDGVSGEELEIPINVVVNRVEWEITLVAFNPGIKYFNVTVQNSGLSLEAVDVAKIVVTLENGTVLDVSTSVLNPYVPFTLNPGENVTFTLGRNWTDFTGINIVVTVTSSKGSETFYNVTVP